MTHVVETLLLRGKALSGERHRQLRVWAVADLLDHERHDLVRDADEADDDYSARSDLFAALLDHARRG